MPSVDYQLGKIAQQLETLENLPDQLTAFRLEVKQDIGTLHKRVDTIASRQSWFAGAATACGAFLGAVVGYFGGHHT